MYHWNHDKGASYKRNEREKWSEYSNGACEYDSVFFQSLFWTLITDIHICSFVHTDSIQRLLLWDSFLCFIKTVFCFTCFRKLDFLLNHGFYSFAYTSQLRRHILNVRHFVRNKTARIASDAPNAIGARSNHSVLEKSIFPSYYAQTGIYTRYTHAHKHTLVHTLTESTCVESHIYHHHLGAYIFFFYICLNSVIIQPIKVCYFMKSVKMKKSNEAQTRIQAVDGSARGTATGPLYNLEHRKWQQFTVILLWEFFILWFLIAVFTYALRFFGFWHTFFFPQLKEKRCICNYVWWSFIHFCVGIFSDSTTETKSFRTFPLGL